MLRACQAKPYDTNITVGVLVGSDVHIATATHGEISEVSAHARAPLGCVTKALAGILAMCAACEGRIDFAIDLVDLVSMDTWPAGVLPGLTIRELLRHSHGIDVSDWTRVPHSPDGFIDLSLLLRRALEVPRLFPPGTLYSYSSAGSWLAAAVLERTYGARFSTLLIDKVLEPAGVLLSSDDVAKQIWCPATGMDLALSVPQLLQVMRWFLARNDLRHHPEMQYSISPPGWSVERGACAGWKMYGSGWFGHNMLWRDRSLSIRVHPGEGAAIIVAGVGASATATMARMFGRFLPEFTNCRIPRILTRAEAADHNGCPGTYANRAVRIRVRLKEGASALDVDITETRDGSSECPSRVRTTTLRPGTDRAYLAAADAADYFQWVQFISLEGSGYRHLWDGRSVFARQSAHSET